MVFVVALVEQGDKDLVYVRLWHFGRSFLTVYEINPNA